MEFLFQKTMTGELGAEHPCGQQDGSVTMPYGGFTDSSMKIILSADNDGNIIINCNRDETGFRQVYAVKGGEKFKEGVILDVDPDSSQRTLNFTLKLNPNTFDLELLSKPEDFSYTYTLISED